MKKLILALLFVCLFSTNALAIWIQGTIKQIRVNVTETIIIMEKDGGILHAVVVSDLLSPAEKNLFMATALTAYSMGSTVVVSGVSDELENIHLKQ